jgi:Sulfotransferase domain
LSLYPRSWLLVESDAMFKFLQNHFSTSGKAIANDNLPPAPAPRRPPGVPPFGVTDLAPVPEAWRIGPPDFVGIASGKAGTSWWYQLLLDHPAIVPNRRQVKEVFYFYHFGYQGLSPEAIEIYRQTFARPEGALCGEWSPGYLTHPLALDYLAEAAPEAKLLALVRNPVDRVISALNMEYARPNRAFNLQGEQEYLFRTLSLFPRVVFNSFLCLHFQHLSKLFDRSQLLVLQYEQCKMDPAAEIARTYRFLGLDDSYVPAQLHQPVNALPYVLPKPNATERARLAEYFVDDVRAFVKQFPQINLELWPDFGLDTGHAARVQWQVDRA